MRVSEGCTSNQGSSKYIWMWTERNTIVQNVAVEGTYVSYLTGSTREGQSYRWEGLNNCWRITPVETTPQSIEFKYPTSNNRLLQNKRMRAIGSLFIIPQIGVSHPNLYLAVDSLMQIY